LKKGIDKHIAGNGEWIGWIIAAGRYKENEI